VNTDRVEIAAGDGRRVVAWRSHEAPAGGGPGRVVVVAPGMGRRMYHAGVIAQYLAANGAVVYRYDALDHVGQSDGDMEGFTVQALVDSMRAVVEHAAGAEPGSRLAVLPVSIAAVPAFHLAAADAGIARIVCLSGVVDLKATLARSLGEDYSLWREEDLPERIRVEGHQMDPRILWHEERRTRWYDVEATSEALARTPAPVVNVIGMADEWVALEEVRRVFGVAGAGERLVVQLPHVTHSVGRNPVALRVVLGAVTRLVLELEEDRDLAEPSFEEILDLRAAERRRDHEEVLALRDRARRAVG
jgi:hypothetical protein